MALFGKKKQAASSDDAPVVAPADDVAFEGEAAPVAPASNRKTKAPKAAKSSGVKSGTVVGLNIGNAFIKAVEVTSKGGQLSVTGVGVVATPPDSYQNGTVLNVSALSNALRTLWKGAGFSTKATVLSVAGTGSLVVRVIEVPKMTDGELQDNMRVDADRYIPFPPSEVVMDFKALRDLPSDPDAANMEVLLAAAQREIIDLHVSVVQKAKLDPRAIDVEPIALARALQIETRAPGQIVDYDDVSAVLNIGETGTEITILRGDIVVFTRSVPNGGGSLTNAIAETLGLPHSEAERLKIENASALAPAGYGESAGDDDDFGFGDFGDATPTGDFGAATDNSAISFDSAPQDTATATASSDDPFDLDFFDQGGQQSQPGAGHGQKEGEEEEKPDAPGGFNFSFDKLDDDLAPSHASENKPAAPQPAQPAPQAEASPPPSMEDFDLPDTYLPAMATPVEDEDEPVSAAPTMPSAFDFSDFDLPTTEAKTAPAAPPSIAPTQKLSEPEDAPIPVALPVATPPVVVPVAVSATPLASTDFGFDMDEAPSIATPDSAAADVTSISIEKTPIAPDVSTQDAPDEADAFDMDAIFGAPATEAAPAPNDEADGFDMGAIDFGAAPAGAGDFDVSALNVASDNDDFASFGTGLSQTGDADAATLYGAIQPVLEDLATEVRRSLEFHLGRYPDTTFSRLVLVGGGAKLRDLDEFLHQNLGVPTVVGDPFAHIEVRAKGLPPEFVPTNAPLCAVALGLALRDFIE